MNAVFSFSREEKTTTSSSLAASMSIRRMWSLISFLKAEVGSVLAPKKIYFFEALPKTAVDKISAAEVRMEIERLRMDRH